MSFDEVVTFDGFVGSATSVAFSPDSPRLAAAGALAREAIKIYDLEGQQELLTLPGEGQAPKVTAFSPDGNTLATHRQGKKLFLWCAPSLEEIEATEASL